MGLGVGVDGAVQQSWYIFFTSQLRHGHNPYLYCIFYIQKTEKQRHLVEIGSGKNIRKIDFGENIIIWILDKSRSVAPAKLEIKLVSPYHVW